VEYSKQLTFPSISRASCCLKCSKQQYRRVKQPGGEVSGISAV